MGGSFAVLVAALGATPVTTYDLSLRTEGRTGTGYVTSTAPTAGPVASYVELYPAAVLSTKFGEVSLEGGYRPRLLYSLNIDRSLVVLHRGNLGGSWKISKRTNLTVDESFSYGRNDFSPLLINPGTIPLDPRLPTLLVLAYFSSTSSVGFSHSVPRGVELGGSASYALAGGLDQIARSYLPLGRTGSVSGRVAYEVTRKDALTSNAFASVTTFSNGAKTIVGNALLGWRRAFAKETSGDASAGVSVTRSNPAGATRSTYGIGPSAGLGVSHQPTLKRRQILRYTARVSYTAAVDPYGGGAYSRIEGILGTDYSPVPWIGLNVRGSGARGISGPPDLRTGLVQLEASSWFTVIPHVSIGGGARSAWLSNPAALQPGFQWAAFLGITIQQQGKL